MIRAQIDNDRDRVGGSGIPEVTFRPLPFAEHRTFAKRSDVKDRKGFSQRNQDVERAAASGIGSSAFLSSLSAASGRIAVRPSPNESSLSAGDSPPLGTTLMFAPVH